MSTNRMVAQVEDNLSYKELFALSLPGFGYDYRHFYSSEDYLAVLHTLPGNHLLMTDMKLPGLSGLELMRLKADRGISRPTMVMSADPGIIWDVPEMKTLGGFAFLVKGHYDPLDIPGALAELSKPDYFRNAVLEVGSNMGVETFLRGEIKDLVGKWKLVKGRAREYAVLSVIHGARSNKDIAKMMILSVDRIKEFSAAVREAFEIKERYEAEPIFRLLWEHGFIDVDLRHHFDGKWARDGWKFLPKRPN